MTQVGEAVSPPSVDSDDTTCPFDHAHATPPDVKNDLVGVGGTLARRMKSGAATHTYEYQPGVKKKLDEKIKNPKDDPDHPFARGKKPVTVNGKQYAVSCAAHHCIPAQESLKESPLLEFMCKKGASEELKGKSFAGGKVWSAVGYDTNGIQNGVFLPGNYAVSGAWSAPDSDDDDEHTEPSEGGGGELTGKLYEISNSNLKWQYVRQAIAQCPGQFHDRHVDYSQFVQSILAKIHANYVNLHATMIGDDKCGDCKKKKQEIEKSGVPTPYKLVDRLNTVSSKLSKWLAGSSWRQNIFTSKWCKAYMDSLG